LNVDKLKERAQEEADVILPRLKEIKDEIGNNPELGSEEYKSSKLLVEMLRKHRFEVEYPYFNMDTAFKGVYKSIKPGPTIALLCEYDALPGVGHGCGHNIIGTSGMGAAIVVSKIIDDIGGQIWAIGTPAEEAHGPYGFSKVPMSKEGVFKDVDVAMMIHPSPQKHMVTANFLGASSIAIEFKGKTAHAAADAHNGVNALNAAVLTYMAIHSNRQQLKRDVNPVIHGIITEGGLASNIIPDKASLLFGVRSSDDKYIPSMIEMVINSAKGAALATGCEVETKVVNGVKPNLRNEPLEKLWYGVFKELGEEVEDPVISTGMIPRGSTDFGDVSQVVPGIHPMVGMGVDGVAAHSKALADLTMTEAGDHVLMVGVKSLALASIELLTDPELLSEVKSYFEKERA
jgi:amidohydrolase